MVCCLSVLLSRCFSHCLFLWKVEGLREERQQQLDKCAVSVFTSALVSLSWHSCCYIFNWAVQWHTSLLSHKQRHRGHGGSHKHAHFRQGHRKPILGWRCFYINSVKAERRFTTIAVFFLLILQQQCIQFVLKQNSNYRHGKCKQRNIKPVTDNRDRERDIKKPEPDLLVKNDFSTHFYVEELPFKGIDGKKWGRLLQDTWWQGEVMRSKKRQKQNKRVQRKDKLRSRSDWGQIPLCSEVQREEVSILYYPPASLASWRIFHLILAVTIENWTRRRVLYSSAILLPYFLCYFSSNLQLQRLLISKERTTLSIKKLIKFKNSVQQVQN